MGGVRYSRSRPVAAANPARDLLAMLLIVAALATAATPAADTSYLYRTLLIRAAPGHLQELIDLYRARKPVFAASDGAPWMLRHRQGDQWDLMLLFPMEGYARYWSDEGIRGREDAAARSGLTQAAFESRVAALASWREELFVRGPALEVVREQFGTGTLYHIEMFVALPERREELFRQRERENAYLAALGRPRNLIFTRAGGAAWDLFTVGVHRDLPAFAASDTIPSARAEAAARAAGFESAGAIGTYLRSLISYHHDTLARSVP